MADLVFEQVGKRLASREVVSDLSFSVDDSEFFVLLGSAGAGKTTILRLAAGLARPSSGRISIGGRDMTNAPPADRNVALVPQRGTLYAHLSAFENLAFPLRSPARGAGQDEIAVKVREVAGFLRLEDRLKVGAAGLSASEAQRIAIGRGLLRRPALLLMDEPLAPVDGKARDEFTAELRRIVPEFGTTILYATSDQTDAMALATRIAIIEGGRLLQVGSPRELYDNPADVSVATRFGEPAMNLMPLSHFPNVEAPPAAVTIGARPEQVSVGKAVGGPEGRVARLEYLGVETHIHVAIGETALVARGDPDPGLRVGDPVAIRFLRPHFFDIDGRRL